MICEIDIAKYITEKELIGTALAFVGLVGGFFGFFMKELKEFLLLSKVKQSIEFEFKDLQYKSAATLYQIEFVLGMITKESYVLISKVMNLNQMRVEKDGFNMTDWKLTGKELDSFISTRNNIKKTAHLSIDIVPRKMHILEKHITQVPQLNPSRILIILSIIDKIQIIN